MTKNRLVSVILPSFNHERFVKKAIESVFAQSYSTLELIVVDDGSTDSSPRLIKEALKNRPGKVKTRFIEQENAGAHAAISTGLKQARGEYLTILNSDDFYHPERIEALVETASSSGAELLFSMVEMVSDDGTPLAASIPEVLWYHEAVSLRHYLPTLGFALIRDNLAVTTGNLFFTRALFERVGPFKPYKYAHDADFVLRALAHTEPRLLSRKLLSYRLHGGNTIRGAGTGIETEGREILNDFMKTALEAGGKTNRFAPCPAFWPRYFNRFLAVERPFFGESRIADYLEESPDVVVRPSTREEEGATQQFQYAPSLTGVNIHLLDRPRASVAPFALFSSVLEEQRSGAATRVGARFITKLVAGALPGGEIPQAIALVHEDRMLATAQPGPVIEGLIECTFVIAAEFDHVELRGATFLALEGNPDAGFALHAGSEPLLSARLDWGSGPRLEPVRLFLGIRAHGIRSAAYSGKIERVRRAQSGDLIVEGWAADPVSREALTGVLLFDGDRRVACRYESRFRRPAEGAPERSGFRLIVPESSLRASPDLGLRAIAIFRRGIAFSLGQIINSATGSECICRLSWTELPREGLGGLERTRTGWRFQDGHKMLEWTLQPRRPGWTDHVDFNSSLERGVIAGWSIDPESKEVPQALVLCDGEVPVVFHGPNWERPDIARVHSVREPLVAGFRFELPRERFPSSLKTYALWSDGAATELPLYEPKRLAATPTAPGTA